MPRRTCRSSPVASRCPRLALIEVGAQILAYINATKNPTVVILPTEDVGDFKLVPVHGTVADIQVADPSAGRSRRSTSFKYAPTATISQLLPYQSFALI
ncbi:unnamed protein product [Urochloa humidicola]